MGIECIWFAKEIREKYNNDPKKCENCNLGIPWDRRRNNTCSPKCRSELQTKKQVGVKHTPERIEKIREAAKNNLVGCVSEEYINAAAIEFEKKLNEYYKNPKMCSECKTVPISWERRKKCNTCSDECLKNLQRKKNGGYKPGSGTSKSGWYNGFFCDSTYELAFVIYCLDHNIKIERNMKCWEYVDPETNKTRKYYPDFLIDNKELVEIKGRNNIINDIKLAAVNDMPIKIMYKEDLKEIFDYVQNKTKTRIINFYLLYEGIQLLPYLHNCKNCNKDFRNNKKDAKFCSKECYRKYGRK